jgi:hypothetical protein
MGIADGASLRRFFSIVEMSGDDLELEIEDGFQQADFHSPAFVGHATADEAGEDALHQMSAGS